MELVEIRGEPSSRAEQLPLTLAIANPRYSFFLERPNRDAPWALKDVVRKASDDQTARLQFGVNHDNMNPALLVGMRLADVIRDPGFRIESIDRDGDGNCRLSFRIDADATQLAASGRPLKGEVVVDPRHMWRLISADLEMHLSVESIGQVECKFEYPADSNDDRFGVPLRTRRDVSVDGQLVDSFEIAIDFATPATLPPDSEFTLTAFGFPEPDWAEQKTTSWTMALVIAGLGIVLVIAGVLIVRRYRRAH